MKSILFFILALLVLPKTIFATDKIPAKGKICVIYSNHPRKFSMTFSCDGSSSAKLEPSDSPIFVLSLEMQHQLNKFIALGYAFETCHQTKLAGEDYPPMACILTK